jgi:diguanylate cyclase (GGDEF)-like protein/PAS domain S-box-containing protein
VTARAERIEVLLVEDSAAEARLVLDALAFARHPRFELRHANRLSQAVEMLAAAPADVVLLDLGLPDAHGLEGLRSIGAAAPGAAVVVRTGLGDERVAIEALAAGAQDYLVKGRTISEEMLQRSILFALARRQADESARRLAAIVESSAEAIIGKSLQGTITSWNPAAQAIYGYTAEEAVGQPIFLLAADSAGAEEMRALLTRVRGGERIAHMESRRRRKDGTVIDVALSISPIRDAHGQVVGASTVAADVTERKRDERALRASEERLRVTVEHAPIGVALVRLDGDGPRGQVLALNDAFCELVGQPESLIREMTLSSIVHPDDLRDLERDLALLGTDRQARVQLEVRFPHADGHFVWVLLSGAAVPAEADGARNAVFHALDVGERKRFEGQLQYLADHDALTGLFNRRRFEEELDRAIAHAERYGDHGAVLLIDLDGFKYVNDTMGHSYGDELVTRVGALMRTALRETDVIARLGGDEFAAILPRVDTQHAMVAANKILRVLERQAIALSEHRHARVTASIGVTVFTAGTRLTAEELIVEADIAMYESKEAGKNRASLYERETNQRSKLASEQSWLGRLKTALDDERFELMAQPVHGICGNGVPRYELLLRLRADDGELVPPGTFLYIAERFELIQRIDRWVFGQAARLLRAHEEAGHDISLSVNMSGKTLNDPHVLSDIEQLLVDCPVPPDRLIVEVTETAAIVNIERAKHIARGLRELGCRFALDDFGAGFASFYYLKHLDFDYLKIDGEFIKALNHNLTDQLVVQSVVQIARGLGAATIAEFVGSQEVVDRLHDLGVDYGQGYFLGRPAPIAEILPAPVG